MVTKALATIVCFLCPTAMRSAPGQPVDDTALSAAICPIVYPVDQFPSDRGYRYLFYGEGFFINEQGYLITAAHVLSQLHGGQPYILLRQTAGPPQFVKATLVAVNRDHDVAVLRATPNPFGDNRSKVGFLPLVYNWPTRGRGVLAASLLPSRPRDAYTLDVLSDGRSSGDVFDFQFSQLDKGRSETELLLFNHQVRLGQSGAPVISAGSEGVVGLIEGQWLRSSVVPLETTEDQGTPGVGAAISIHYAITMLQQMGIPWHTPSGASEPSDNPPEQAGSFSAPTPLSLVASSYPSQALFGGEVVLDALIDSRGRLVDTRVVHGSSPFLEKVLGAVRTWSFFPARLDGHAVAARIGITFQFSQSYEPPGRTLTQQYNEPLSASSERGPLPVVTVEPQHAGTNAQDGSVILYDLVGRQGQVTAVQILSDPESLSAAAVAAADQWRFVPGKRAGTDTDSAAIVVMAIRHLGNAPSISQPK